MISSTARATNERRRFARILSLDHYLFREFFVAFFAVMAFCGVLILVASLFDKLNDIFQHDPPISSIILYFACSLPYKLVQVVPIAALLAVLFSVGGLARQNEMVALLTSGFPALRIAAPIIFGGLLISGCTFLLNETVIPDLQSQARIHELQMEKKDIVRAESKKNIFIPGRVQRDYVMRLYVPQENRMIRPVIYERNEDGSGFLRKVAALDGYLKQNMPEDKKSIWRMINMHEWTFDSSGVVTKYQFTPGESTLELEEDLPQLFAQRRTPEEMNFQELRQHIRMLAERGQPVSAYKTDMLLKITFPAGILLLVVIGFAYAIRTRAGTAMTIFGQATLWAFGYYLTTAFFQAIGHTGQIAPIIAASLPLSIFAVASLIYLRRASRWYA